MHCRGIWKILEICTRIVTVFMKLSPEKVVVVEFSQTELLNVDRFFLNIFISLSQVSQWHTSVRFRKTPKNRTVFAKMNRFESLESILNAHGVRSYFNRDDTHWESLANFYHCAATGNHFSTYLSIFDTFLGFYTFHFA